PTDAVGASRALRAARVLLLEVDELGGRPAALVGEVPDDAGTAGPALAGDLTALLVDLRLEVAAGAELAASLRVLRRERDPGPLGGLLRREARPEVRVARLLPHAEREEEPTEVVAVRRLAVLRGGRPV